MLKSTYRVAPAEETLPADWTEHKAPTGHTYYYNAKTKQSTYKRPVAEPESQDFEIDYNATAPDQVVQASMKALDEFHKNNPAGQKGQGQFAGGRSYQDRSRRDKNQDRPKSRKPILNCEPWILVYTKFGRRFVHNAETKESFWKFPQDVMLAVIAMDKIDWETKNNTSKETETNEESDKPTHTQPIVAHDTTAHQHDYDSDEYEEVEVTDDEDENESMAKRIRTEQDQAEAPPSRVEFDEDDIAWQLAQMEGDELENEEYELEGGEDEEGLPLTAEDSIALFRSLLDDSHVDTYSTFDALIEYDNASIIEDPRWISLPNMSSRRTAFTNWSRDRIAETKAQNASSASAATTKRKHDPRVAYLNFLQDHATPKLYWPEFKRKFRKEPEMKDLNLADKDREKLYREYIPKLKMSDVDRKREFRDVLKAIPQGESWCRQTSVDDLPDALLKDLRFYVIRDRSLRDDLVRGHIDTLDHKS